MGLAIMCAVYIKKIESLAYIREMRTSNQVEVETESIFSDSSTQSN